jgi:hypothetical protein
MGGGVRKPGSVPRRGRLALLALLPAALLLAAPSAASAATVVFSYNGTATGIFAGTDGSPQPWVVPAGVTSATFDVYGAQGGAGAGTAYAPHAAGGLGAHLHAQLPVTPAQTLQIYVGGAAPGLGVEAGGFNGGGGSGLVGNLYTSAGGGGGASDIRSGAALTDRLLIAGGGGGGGGNGLGPGPGGNGGAAGGAGGASGTTGSAGTNFGGNTAGGPGGPGGPGAGGSAGSAGMGDGDGNAGQPGDLGAGGGVPANANPGGGHSGGGGGGLYGGGSGGGGSEDSGTLGAGGGGGGGGSSFATLDATDVSLLDGVRAGHGQVVINYAEPPAKPNTRITKKPKNRGKGKGKKRKGKKRYVFRFEDDLPGVSFRCAIDDEPFVPCSSPVAYKGLKRGKHTFQVKSVTADGIESTPQTTEFRVGRRNGR